MIKQETRFGRLLCDSEEGAAYFEIAIFRSSGKPHVHDKYENCFVIEGNCWVYIDKAYYYVGQGDVIVIPPGCKHWMKPDVVCKMGLAYSKRPLTLSQYGHTKHRFIRHRMEMNTGNEFEECAHCFGEGKLHTNNIEECHYCHGRGYIRSDLEF